MKITVVYHSSSGGTQALAREIVKGIQQESVAVACLSILDAQADFSALHEASAIVFGCPTCFGNISAAFKRFMEKTAVFIPQQLWKDKLAAGFTCLPPGEKGQPVSLASMAHFAARHEMIWLPADSCQGLATTISTGANAAHHFDQSEAQRFGQKIAAITKHLFTNQQ